MKTTASAYHTAPTQACGMLKMGEHTSQNHSYMFSVPFPRVSLAWSSPVRQDSLASEPRDPPVSTSQHWVTDERCHTLFYVGSGTQVLKFYYLLSSSKYIFNKRDTRLVAAGLQGSPYLGLHVPSHTGRHMCRERECETCSHLSKSRVPTLVSTPSMPAAVPCCCPETDLEAQATHQVPRSPTFRNRRQERHV